MCDENYERIEYEAPAWEPIETAPKDGTEILIFVPDFANHPDSPVIISALWNGSWWQDNGAVGCNTWGNPTHWMSLPDPPEPEAENGIYRTSIPAEAWRKLYSR